MMAPPLGAPMEVSKEDLEERYRNLADHVLLERLQAGTLTPLATQVALAELRSRGLELAAERADAPEKHDDELAEPDEPLELDPDVDLVSVARFTNVLEANVLRACLESHGIFAFVWGEHLGTAHIFLSIASGGVRVQVRQDQVEQAKEVIRAFERGDFALDEEPE
jgi:hypothetical protein